MEEAFENLSQVPDDRGAYLTIGKFDAVHLGHKRLIGKVVERAEVEGGGGVVLTIYPSPEEILLPDQRIEYLTTLEERVPLLATLGVDHIAVLRFSQQVAEIRASEFVELLLKHLRLKELWVGPDFALGYKREGDITFLRNAGQEHGFNVRVVVPQRLSDQTVSSSRIRDLVREGEVEKAARMLGRYYSLRGEVVHGDGRGKDLGFPTANLDAHPKKVIPEDGVYATWVQLGGERLGGAASIGVRPTFDGKERVVEVYILDFEREIYGAKLDLHFVKHLREEMRFDSADDLVAQMHEDVRQIREVLRAAPERKDVTRTQTPPGTS